MILNAYILIRYITKRNEAGFKMQNLISKRSGVFNEVRRDEMGFFFKITKCISLLRYLYKMSLMRDYIFK